eukprot:SAG11_NODE_23395_length_389_cov_1.065517_1_plen_46_part_10
MHVPAPSPAPQPPVLEGAPNPKSQCDHVGGVLDKHALVPVLPEDGV